MRILRMALLAVPLMSSAPLQETTDHDSLLARVRQAALLYSDSLQDFICTETLTRSKDDSGTGKHWKLLEKREMDLGYIGHKEHYRLLTVNGKTTNAEQRLKKGYFQPGGEFGSTLLYVFSAEAEAHFDRERDCAFRFHVPVATSMVWITADMDHVRMAYKGTVTADCVTGDVLQLHFETEPAYVRRGGHDILIGEKVDMRYGGTAIGGKEFLLPQEATTVAPFGQTLTKAEIQFRDYRKYDASSNITFDDGQ